MINTRFWNDSFISELNPLDRYLFLYFLTNEHTNIAGIYELPIKTISFETGLEIDMVKKMLKRLSSKVMYLDGWICVKNFQKHQATSSKDVQEGIKREMSNIPENVRVKLEEGYKNTECIEGLVSVSYTKPNLTKPNLTKPPESNSGEIGVLIKSFETINPASKNFYKRIPQRKACEFLISTYGFERVKNVIENTIPKTNRMEYLPTITTPIQLLEKWSSLEAGILKLKGKQKEKSKIAFQ